MSFRHRWDMWSEAMRTHWHVALSCALLVMLLAVYWLDPPLLARLRHATFDTFQRLHPRPYLPVPVRIVDLDEESLGRLGQWPWPRTQVAQLVERLLDMGAGVVALDITFAEPDRLSPANLARQWPDQPALAELLNRLPDNDAVLARTFAEAGGVVTGFMARMEPPAPRLPARKARFVIRGPDPRPLLFPFPSSVTNLPALEEAADGNGAFSFIKLDDDGVIRKVPLVLRFGDHIYPTLLVEAVRVAQGEANIRIDTAGGPDNSGPLRIESITIGEITAATDSRGEVWLHYSKPQPSRYIPAWKVLANAIDPDQVAGHILFVGTSAKGLMDLRFTPLGREIPGVEIHAQMVEQLLQDSYLRRPAWVDGLTVPYVVILWLVMVLIQNRSGALWSALAMLLVVGSTWYAAWNAFLELRLLVDPSFPTLACLLLFLSLSVPQHVRSEREKRWTRDAFSQYLAPAVVDIVVRDPAQLKLGGEEREMTALFTDLSGFTGIAESMSAPRLVEMLNGYLTAMSGVVLAHHGTIDKFHGDAVMAFWNAPLIQPDHALAACHAAMDMQACLEEIRQRPGDIIPWQRLFMRVGVHTGPMVVGNMGGRQRIDYTIIGDAVNLASRLEGANKYYGTGILISESTWQRVQDGVDVRPLGPIQVRGRKHPEGLYQLLARKGELRPPLADLLPLFARGLDLYTQGDFAQAIGCFEKVLAVLPDDGPSRVFLNRCFRFRQHPPGPGWEAVFEPWGK
ncbi:MAG: CHASE2 domain-containing protein [Magnetococcales bacterium]|nr:CHASE2 domain-containing protein [Magnetococcales bacterium]